MPRKNGIMFTKPDEPAFLRRIKAQFGYKEGPNLETKNEELPEASDDDYADRDDEKPVFVIPKNSKVTEREVEAFVKSHDEDGEEVKGNVHGNTESSGSGGRVVFKKPNKTRNEETIKVGTKRNKEESSSRPKIAKLDDNRKKSNDNRLLSFGDDEEDS